MSVRILLLLLVNFFGASLTAQYATEITVALDGSGDYTGIQAAIDATKAFPDERITIFIKNGTYREKVKVHAWNNRLTLRGESAEKTIITYDDHFDKIDRGRNSTFHTWTVLVQGDDFRAENLTIANTAGPVGQALALSVEADRAVFENCRLLGHQDTLYVANPNARQYFKNCYIEGTTDFIFGEATALFDSCTIHSKADSYITAASTPPGKPYGFVFRHCRLTADPGVKAVYLGRPWRDYAKVAFVHTHMGNHIRPEGWENWGEPKREKTTFYAEYGNTGPGATLASRVSWSHRLSPEAAAKYTPEHILAPVPPAPMSIGEGPAGQRVRFVSKDSLKQIEVYIGDRLFTAYHYGGGSLKKPVLFPLLTHTGKPVTRGYPLATRPGEQVDHPHHYGLWFNHGDVNGIDFWNNSDAIAAERRHLYGSIVHREVVEQRDGEPGVLKVSKDWIMPDGGILLKEETAYTFSGGPGYRRIDHHTTLKAQGEKVVFEDSKEGMFALRVARQLEQPYPEPVLLTDATLQPAAQKVVDTLSTTGLYTNSEGDTGDAVWGRRARWVKLAGEIEGDSIAIVILDAPQNPNHPPHWMARGYGLFGVNAFGSAVYSDGKEQALNFTLEPGEAVHFRHRVLIYEGKVPGTAAVEAEFEAFKAH